MTRTKNQPEPEQLEKPAPPPQLQPAIYYQVAHDLGYDPLVGERRRYVDEEPDE